MALDGATGITAQVGSARTPDGGFGINAHLIGYLPGLEQGQAEDLMLKAHQVCPYSKATRGNIDVTLAAKVDHRAQARGDLAGALIVGIALAAPAAARRPTLGWVSYAVLGRVGRQHRRRAMTWESVFTDPVPGFWVDLPACNNWADIGLPEVYNDPDLARSTAAITQTSATDKGHLVKQAVGVFRHQRSAARSIASPTEPSVALVSPAMHLEDGTTEVWSFGGRRAHHRHRRRLGQRKPASTGAVPPRPDCGKHLLQARSASPAAGPR